MLVAAAASVVVGTVARPRDHDQPLPLSDQASGGSTVYRDLGVEIRTNQVSPGETRVWVRSSRWRAIADPLLYWTAVAPADSTALPADARFLGSLGSAFREPIRLSAPLATGVVVLWSNANRRVVGIAAYPAATVGGR
jgi:hypothetical protein